MKSTSPPTGVQARPVATPGWRVRRLASREEARAAEQLAHARLGDRRAPADCRSSDSATWRATLRHTVPISRSRLRTPASRVYSRITVRSAASENAIHDFFSPLRSIWRGTR